MATTINSLFSPAAVYNANEGQYFVQCDATAPAFGVQIGDQILWTDPKNMILPQVRDPRSGLCSTGVAGTGGAPYILGDTFMQGLVSVFDVSEKMEIRFAKRL
jgi:Eukaryotic aspartyl protease